MPNAPFTWGPQGPLSLQPGTIQLQNGHFLGNDGPKNYLVNPVFETGLTTGWSLGTTGALTNGIPTGTPTFGSGAAGTLSLNIVSSGAQLAGTYSLQYQSTASLTVGNMFASDAFTIDQEDQGKVLSWSFRYKPQTNVSFMNFSGTGANTYGIAAYDVTNSVWLGLIGQFSMIQNAGVGIASGSFQTASNGSQIRLVIYNVTTTASGTVGILFDDMFCGPSGVASAGSAISWNGSQTSQAVTANVTNIAFTTIKDSSGAWNGTQYVVPVAGDYFIATTFVSSVAAVLQPYLNGSIYISSSTILAFATTNTAAAAGSILITGCKPGDLISIRSNTSTTITAGVFSVFAIASPSSGSVGAGGVVTWSGTQSSQSSTANVTNVAFTTVNDSAGAWNGTQFVVPISGTYVMGGTAQLSTASTPKGYKNGVAIGGFGTAGGSGGSISSGTVVFTNCIPGDLLSLRTDTTVTVTNGQLGIFLVQNNSQGTQPSPVVTSQYSVLTGNTTSSTVPINFDNKIFDTNASITPSATVWKYTAQVSGYFSVIGFIASSTGIATTYSIYKNGSLFLPVGAGSLTFNTTSFAGSVPLIPGDFIDIRGSASATITSGTITVSLIK